MKCRFGQRGLWALAVVLAFSSMAYGQQVLRGSIAGTIRDNTGGALPGVTVTVTSPALQVPSLVEVSNERGEYTVPDLPAGTFRVSFELPGFATMVREGLVLTTGFAARVDISMQVAALTETITVSGESPVVDVTTTRGGATISKELLAAIPTNLNFRDTMLMVGGMQANNAPMVGQVTAQAIGFNGVSYGAGMGGQVAEGMKRLTFAPANFSAYEEVDVKTFGNTADVDNSGAMVQLVVKSGGNEFHGRYNDTFQHKRFQSANLDDALRAQGLTSGDTIEYFNDFTADLGGRIIRDKLWFYANGRLTDNKFTSTGFVTSAGPDGIFRTGDESPAFPQDRIRAGIVKISWQPTQSHRFTGLYHDNNNHYFQYYSPFVPLESTARHNQLSRDIKPLDYQGTFGNKLLISQMYGIATFSAYRIWNGPDGAVNPTGGWVTGSGVPARLNRNTLQRTGPAWDENVLGTSQNPSHQIRGSVSYLPDTEIAGTHQFQVGYLAWFSDAYRAFPGGIVGGCTYGRDVCPTNQGIGEYMLIYDTVNNVPNQGVEMIVKNFPVTGVHNRKNFAVYGMDTWRPTSRITINAGLRWERKLMHVPAQRKEPSIPAGFTQAVGAVFETPSKNVGDFAGFAPRLGLAWDVSGDARTVAKVSYGKFNLDLDYDYGSNFSLNRPVEYTFRWNDLNRDGNYQPGEVNLDLNGSDFLSVAGVTNLTFNPDLDLPYTHEVSASLERQLGEGFALRGLYVYKRLVGGSVPTGIGGAANPFTSVNVRRPASVYDQAFTRRDLGPDGLYGTGDDGPDYQIYDYNPAYRGAAFVENMLFNTASDRQDTYKNYEVMLTKRTTGRWFGNVSFLATQSNVWRVKVRTSPNDDIFPVSNYWDMSFLVAGGYNLPWGVSVSTLFQAYNGLPRQRVVQFRAQDPAGAALPRFPSSTNIVLPMEELGDTRAPARRFMNLRFGKMFGLPGSQRVNLNLDVFNVFNTNVPWGNIRGQNSVGNAAMADLSGPTYGNALQIVQPRMVRFGFTYEF